MNRMEWDIDEIRRLRSLKFGWVMIADKIGCHRNTLSHWRRRVEYSDDLLTITDAELDVLVAKVLEGRKNEGQMELWARLQGMGYDITRQRVRNCIDRVQHEEKEERKKKKRKRKVYESAGPHHCWHIDGWHKLIRYNMVVHGCIDGYSRTLIYLTIMDNNRSKSTMQLFDAAVKEHQVPAAVYCDHGGENVRIADFMHANRPDDEFDPVKVGSSKHNTRIERLWRDARNVVLDFYITLFRSYEKDGMLLTDVRTMFLLRYMFIPRIQADLDRFIVTWNGHHISTEGYRSPLQLMEMAAGSMPPPVDDLTYVTYPSDTDVLLPGQPNVEVDALGSPFNEEQFDEFEQHVIALSIDDTIDQLTVKFSDALNLAEEILAVL